MPFIDDNCRIYGPTTTATRQTDAKAVAVAGFILLSRKFVQYASHHFKGEIFNLTKRLFYSSDFQSDCKLLFSKASCANRQFIDGKRIALWVGKIFQMFKN